MSKGSYGLGSAQDDLSDLMVFPKAVMKGIVADMATRYMADLAAKADGCDKNTSYDGRPK